VTTDTENERVDDNQNKDPELEATPPNPETEMPQSDIEVQLQKLRTDMAALAKTVASYGADTAGAYTAKVRQGANEAIEASQTAFDGIRTDFVALESEVANRVRARPLQAVGLAIGIGFLLALVSRR
jgi:ElaB/YqjD/DUF883 family membrane-anchored ribosome-binding protein